MCSCADASVESLSAGVAQAFLYAGSGCVRGKAPFVFALACDLELATDRTAAVCGAPAAARPHIEALQILSARHVLRVPLRRVVQTQARSGKRNLFFFLRGQQCLLLVQLLLRECGLNL
jgi:hypothetical protein